MSGIYRVFISSTYRDNAKRRKVIFDAVQRAGMLPVGMELFAAKARPAVEVCESLARECDLYLGLIAHRYGWVPSVSEGGDGESSITELEYQAAREKPRLVLQIDLDQPFSREDVDEGADRWRKQERLEAFRATVSGMPARFRDENLGVVVYQTLMEWKLEQEAGGDSTPQPNDMHRIDDSSLTRYLSAARSLHSHIDLAGFKTRVRVPIALEDLHVPLHGLIDLRPVGPSEFADAEHAEREIGERAREVPLTDALTEAKRRGRSGVVILGDPGSGKTTHLKRLLLWCVTRDPRELGLESDTIPVFLPLRALRDVGSGLEAFIDAQLEDPHLGMSAGFGAWLRDCGRPLLLLFDGLDEVADPSERVLVARWIEGVAKSWSRCTSVVTCRFAGYSSEAQLDPMFLELHVRPMTQEQSEAFIRAWFVLVEQSLAVDPEQGASAGRAQAEALIEQLREPDFRTARVALLIRNPLLLANLCLVRHDRGVLPRGRTRLYSECIEVLLERWRMGKELEVALPAEQSQRVLQPAAYWLHEEVGRTRASAEELAPVIQPALAAVQWREGGAREFLARVRDESGLLTGWGPDSFGFMHLGFQEFLAAAEIRRRWLERDDAVLAELAGHWGESWWQEVILLLLAQGNPSLFAPLLREVIQRPEFTAHPEVLNLVLEESAEVSDAPFSELLRQPADAHPDLWHAQLVALQVLERLDPELARSWIAKMERHPSVELRRWTASRDSASSAEAMLTEKGGVELVRIPAGSFSMGSPASEVGRRSSEGPQHEVKLESFYIGRYPVTNEEYGRYLAAKPDAKPPRFWGDRRFAGERQPVVGVTWDDARRFATWAGCRLPSEAEWEYVARAGTTEPHLTGATEDDARRFAWFGEDYSKGSTYPVGEKEANPWGVHDMLGNVWEWVEDDWHEDYVDAPRDGSAWIGDPRADRRVVRGGSWFVPRIYARCAFRGLDLPGNHGGGLGFRVVRVSPIRSEP